MTHHTHLSDDRLIEVCLNRTAGRSEREHLDGCEVCDARRASLSRLLLDASDAAHAEADEIFTSERLNRQRTRILHRLEQDGRPGRVVSFPAGQAHSPTPARARPGMRWMAGAAAAGLIIGMLAGHYVPVFPPADAPPAAIASSSWPASPALRAATAMTEEEFLGRLERAVEGSSGSALRPLHDLTPLVWEVSAP